MDIGFNTLKDWLQVLIIPVTIFVAGALLPRWFEAEKKRKFLALIEQELNELEPWPKEPDKRNWPEHLDKEFVHQEIFAKPSENRDFILALPAEVVYNVSQLWSAYKTASESTESADFDNQGERWLAHLCKICRYFDTGKTDGGKYYTNIYEPWERLVRAYRRKGTQDKIGDELTPNL